MQTPAWEPAGYSNRAPASADGEDTEAIQSNPIQSNL